MEFMQAAFHRVTGLPQPAVPAPVPSEIIAQLPTIRSTRSRGRARGYGLRADEEGRRITRGKARAGNAMPLPQPAAPEAEFGFNPIIPQAAVGISRSLSTNAEQRQLRGVRGESHKRKRTTKRTTPVRSKANLGAFPEDLLYLIFSEAAKEDRAFGRTVNLVCRRWNVIAQGMPTLWSNIHISSKASFVAAEGYLQRSRNAPLTVYLRNLNLQEARQDRYFLNAAVALVKPHKNRITSLTIRTHTVSSLSYALSELLLGPSAAPLVMLDVNICVPVPQAPAPGLLRLRMPKTLEALRIDRIHLTHVGTPRGLRHLHIARPEAWANNFQMLHQIATAYPHLCSLRIDNWERQLQPIPFDGTKNLVMEELKELRLFKCRGDNVALLLRHLAPTNLTTVDVVLSAAPHDPNARGYQELHNVVIRELVDVQNYIAAPTEDGRLTKAGIRSLSLTGMQTSLWDLFKLFRACFGLRSLAFTRCNTTNDTLNWLGNAAMSEAWLCPELESLKLEECSAVEGYAVRQFAFNRWQGAQNGWIKQFQEIGIRNCYRVEREDIKFAQQRVPKIVYSP